jgi:sulfoxide reductase heme-binding subunit YedZ
LNSTLLWYTTRGAGVVSMVLLSGVMALGMLTRARAGGRRWPRFLTAALHRDLSLMALVFLGLHIVTAVVDPTPTWASPRRRCRSAPPTGPSGWDWGRSPSI